MIVVDCGLGFPEDEMYGVDLVIPDVTYLVKNANKMRGFFITHGHEDHIGALPYVLEAINAPVHATRLTSGLIKLKLEEHRLLSKTKVQTHEAGAKVKAGCFTVEFIHVNHSIADAVALAIHTPVGVVFMTGDFKIDPTAEDGMIDLARIGQLGNEGVLALLCDSTNVERQGYTAVGIHRDREPGPPIPQLRPAHYRDDLRLKYAPYQRNSAHGAEIRP